jgi:hypothetical protein
MPSEIIARGCAPDEAHPLVDTVARASLSQLADIHTFWQAHPDSLNMRALALSIIEREIFERTSLDATAVLTPAQQRRVLAFARRATCSIPAFESFYVVLNIERSTVWMVYHERQQGHSLPHALQVDADGCISDSVDGIQAEALNQLSIINIIPLLAEDGSDTMVFQTFKPPRILPETALLHSYSQQKEP